MKTITLNAQKRTVFGRKVKTLRAAGSVPANIFGNKIESVAITVDAKEFVKVQEQAGGTSVVEVVVGQEKHPVLIKNAQTNPVSQEILHVDFYQVNLNEKVTAMVPVEIVGESPAVTGNVGVLLQLVQELEVEALPQELPEKISVDVSSLLEVGQSIKLQDISIPQGVEVKSEPELDLVKIDVLVQAEPEPEATETPAEGEEKTEESAADAATTESEEKAEEKE